MKVDPAFLRRLVRLGERLGASDVVVSSHETMWQMIRFSNNRVTVSKTGSTSSVDVYASVKGRRAVQSTTEVSPKPLQELVKRVVA
ncbi:MAG: hypothetical protein NZ581_08305, partial [Candidatus Caldarchaeum sp.]|nr:hypothetical protein [Candidatus Caldarchaeum sp.]MDW8436175.1 hypothetical protein [Candidatus Caldarchaeum sp.]